MAKIPVMAVGGGGMDLPYKDAAAWAALWRFCLYANGANSAFDLSGGTLWVGVAVCGSSGGAYESLYLAGEVLCSGSRDRYGCKPVVVEVAGDTATIYADGAIFATAPANNIEFAGRGGYGSASIALLRLA